jgi:hypothetical protein
MHEWCRIWQFRIQKWMFGVFGAMCLAGSVSIFVAGGKLKFVMALFGGSVLSISSAALMGWIERRFLDGKWQSRGLAATKDPRRASTRS